METEQSARFITIPLVVLLSAIGIGFSIYLISIASNLYTIIVALLFTVLTLVASFFNIMAAYSYYDSYFYEKKFRKEKFSKLNSKPLDVYPTVAIVVPVYNEEPRVVETTLKKLMNIEYDKSKLHFYLVDDSTKPETVEELKNFSEANGISFIHRQVRKGFKAGALNNFLKVSNEEFIAIFDADEYLVNKRFLLDLIPYFKDKKIGYVQTEKRYSKYNFFADSINLFNSFFFSFIQPSRASHNTSIFAGSCGIIRRKALDKIGGFPEYIIEDTFFSFESRIKSYRGIYIPKVYALGRPLKRFTAFARQQWRYNYGGTQFLGYFLKKSPNHKFKFLEKVDYIALGFGLNYLSVVLILFTLLSVLIVFASFPFSNVSMSQIFNPAYIKSYLEIFGIIALLLSFIAPIIVSRIYFNSFKYGIMIYLMNFALAIIRTKAAIAALLNSNPVVGWAKGDKSKRGLLISAFKNSITEVAFSIALFSLGIYAFTCNNISGSIWLIWFAILYGSAFFFFYKYG